MTPPPADMEAARLARLAQTVDALSAAERAALAPVIRRVVHDLNGYLSTLSMECFTIGHHAAGLAVPQPRAPAGVGAELAAALENLEQATADAAAYLARLRALVDGDGGD